MQASQAFMLKEFSDRGNGQSDGPECRAEHDWSDPAPRRGIERRSQFRFGGIIIATNSFFDILQHTQREKPVSASHAVLNTTGMCL
jgi:hypothetical protein